MWADRAPLWYWKNPTPTALYLFNGDLLTNGGSLPLGFCPSWLPFFPFLYSLTFMLPCQCKVVSFEPQSGAHGMWLKKETKILRPCFSVSHFWSKLLQLLCVEQNSRNTCVLIAFFVFSFTILWTFKWSKVLDNFCDFPRVIYLTWGGRGRKKNSCTEMGTWFNFVHYNAQKAKEP